MQTSPSTKNTWNGECWQETWAHLSMLMETERTFNHISLNVLRHSVKFIIYTRRWLSLVKLRCWATFRRPADRVKLLLITVFVNAPIGSGGLLDNSLTTRGPRWSLDCLFLQTWNCCFMSWSQTNQSTQTEEYFLGGQKQEPWFPTMQLDCQHSGASGGVHS